MLCFLITADNGLKIITDSYEAGFRGIINYESVKEFHTKIALPTVQEEKSEIVLRTSRSGGR